MSWKPSPGTVMGTLALVVALSGTAIGQSGLEQSKSLSRQDVEKIFKKTDEIPPEFYVALAKSQPEKKELKGYVDSRRERQQFTSGLQNSHDVFWSTQDRRRPPIKRKLIKPDAIGPAQLATNSVTETAIAPNAVTTPAIQKEAVTNSLIAKDAVGTSQIIPDAITTQLIASKAITTSLIASNAITAPLIGDRAIESAAIADNAIQDQHVENVSLSNLTMNTGWSTAAEDPAEYSIDAEGVVHLRGVLFRANDPGTAAAAFQLPGTVMPQGVDREFAVAAACGGFPETVVAYVQGQGAAANQGEVSFSPGDCSYYRLDGISYVP